MRYGLRPKAGLWLGLLSAGVITLSIGYLSCQGQGNAAERDSIGSLDPNDCSAERGLDESNQESCDQGGAL